MKIYITLNYKKSLLFLKQHRKLENGCFTLNSFTYDINSAWVSRNKDTTGNIFMHVYYNLHENLNDNDNRLQINTAESLKITENYIKVFDEKSQEYSLHEIQPEVKTGFKSFGVHLWPDCWIESYNRYTYEINRTRLQSTRNFLLDNRHKFFVWADNELIINKVQA